MVTIDRSRNPEFDIKLTRGEERESAFVELLLASADEVRIEVKSSPDTLQKGGSLFVELYDDAQGPTGLSITKAEVWVYEYAPDRWLVLKVTDIWRIIEGMPRSKAGYAKRVTGVWVPLVRLLHFP